MSSARLHATRRLAGMLPVGVAIAGRRRDLAMHVLARLGGDFDADSVITKLGPLVVAGDHKPETLLSYAFANVRRYYRRSPLGRYIAAAGTGTFVDVGANLGMYSLIAREHGMHAVLVEPEPRHAAFLRRNMPTLGPIHSIAMSNKPGQLPLYYEAANSGATSLVPAPGFRQSVDTVPVTTFSEVAGSGGFGDPHAIRLVKIDVEGAEEQLVEGMAQFLAEGHRPAVWCEVRGDGSNRNGGSFRSVRRRLESAGYTTIDPIAGWMRAPNDCGLAARSVFDLLFAPAESEACAEGRY